MWMAAGIDEDSNWVGEIVWNDRSRANVVDTVMRRCIRPGSDVITDKAKIYVIDQQGHQPFDLSMVAGMNWSHLWVNHRHFFVDPITNACTNRIEGFFGNFKAELKASRGIAHHRLADYVDYFMWQSRVCRSPDGSRLNGSCLKQKTFEKLIEAIVSYYVVN